MCATGSILGPLLFIIIYVNDLPDVYTTMSYAADSVSGLDAALEEDLNGVASWVQKNE